MKTKLEAKEIILKQDYIDADHDIERLTIIEEWAITETEIEHESKNN